MSANQPRQCEHDPGGNRAHTAARPLARLHVHARRAGSCINFLAQPPVKEDVGDQLAGANYERVISAKCPGQHALALDRGHFVLSLRDQTLKIMRHARALGLSTIVITDSVIAPPRASATLFYLPRPRRSTFCRRRRQASA